MLESKTLEALAEMLMQMKQEFPVTLNEPCLGPVNFCWEFLTIAFSVVPRGDNKGLVLYLCAVISHWMHGKFPCHIISLGTFAVLNITPDCRPTMFMMLKKENFIFFQLMRCCPCISPWNRIIKHGINNTWARTDPFSLEYWYDPGHNTQKKRLKSNCFLIDKIKVLSCTKSSA